MDPPDTSQGFYTTLRQFFMSNFDYNLLLAATKEIVQMKKEDFVNRIINMVGDETKNKDKKDKLNQLRLRLAKHVYERFDITSDFQIRNRTATRNMAIDIWNLVDSIVETRITPDCMATYVNKSMNISLNDSINQFLSVNESDTSSNNDLKKLLENLLNEIHELKESNDKILKCVQDLKSENVHLKKIINDQSKFKNFNLYNRDSTNDPYDSDCAFESNASKGSKKRKKSYAPNDVAAEKDDNSNEESVFKAPMAPVSTGLWRNVVANNSSKGTKNEKMSIKKANSDNISKSKKSKFIVGSQNGTRKGATRIYHYYTGFWHIDNSIEDVSNHIKSFAHLEEIEQLNTENKYYKSFHIQVFSTESEKILDPVNWPIGVRVKRFFEAKDKSKKSDFKGQNDRGLYRSSSRGVSRGGHRNGISGRSGTHAGGHSLSDDSSQEDNQDEITEINQNEDVGTIPVTGQLGDNNNNMEQ